MSKPSRMPYFNQAGGKEQVVLAEGYLPTDKIFKIDRYLRYFGMLSQSIEDYLQGNIKGKLKKPTKRVYGYFIVCLCGLVMFRNLVLAFVDDVEYRQVLGEAVAARPARQVVMALTLWSVYSFLMARLYYRGEKLRYMAWLAPFAVFKGFIPPSTMGLDTAMTDNWFTWTKKNLAKMALFINIRAVLGSMMFAWVAYIRFRAHSVPQPLIIFWTGVLTIWTYYAGALAYMSFGHFTSLAYYFRMRFHKVNEDIESIIAPDNRMKPNDRCNVLSHVLNEHNELCIKIKQYNLFWSYYMMYTYFMCVAIICYTLFQAFFTYNRVVIRIVMFSFTCEVAYIITKVSFASAKLSNELRMFIQRLSGPTIGFYCLDLWEITYSTYASIIAALGQNFLLIVDFVRSYAELKEEQQKSELDFSVYDSVSDIVTNSTFNLDPLSMTNEGLKAASSLTSLN